MTGHGFDPERMIAMPPRIITHRYTERDTMLYALGVGAGQDPAIDELAFVYEQGLKALPTMAVTLASPGFWQMEPNYGIEWQRVLHAEQSCTFHRPLPSSGVVRGEMSFDAVVDKGVGKGCLLRTVRKVFDADDDGLLATVRQVSFLRSHGGCGSYGAPLPVLTHLPDRSPDEVLTLAVRPEQAMIYRLSGDYNPLHIDRSVAVAAGFPGPILHGLCSYGFVGRGLVNALCGGDTAQLAELDCRFTAPVIPGDVLQIEVWRITSTEIRFRTSVAARGQLVLDRGMARMNQPF